MREGVWLPPLSRLDHLPLLLVLAVGFHTSLSLEGYSFCVEKTLSLEGA
jgi:hypothetical protein